MDDGFCAGCCAALVVLLLGLSSTYSTYCMNKQILELQNQTAPIASNIK